ncbi:MAG: T9SS type A sorting domain-containing protein [Flavobacteriales bacterium]|nr:T9SS type A sorting domain-containing protein [Flavobacteriales bacterium]
MIDPNRSIHASMLPGLLLGLVMQLTGQQAAAQGNLVYNGSFELHDTCRQVLGFYSETDGPLGWFSASGSPDYYQGCLPSGTANGIPQSTAAFQYPQDGEYFAGLVTYQLPSGLREYMAIELSEYLVVGETYFVSFFANAAWNGSEEYPGLYAASSHVGALFIMDPGHWNIGDPYRMPGNHAQVYRPDVLADTVNWTLVSGSFVADSAYRYIMLGNHFDNATTDTVLFAHHEWLPKAYTLIDNVRVSTDPLPSGMAHYGSDGVRLYPNPSVGVLTVSGVPPGTSMQVLDTAGRLVYSGVVASALLQLDVASWARGSYVLRAVKGEESRAFKFVLTE